MIIALGNISKLVNKQLPKVVKNDFLAIAQERFNRIKQEMIAEFLAHPVTQEIKSGPSGYNISGTLGGNGNLFSFIGFENGSDPTKVIEDLLLATNLTILKEIDGGIMFGSSLPSAQDIFAVTPMPWAEGRSWAKGIESGISGLGEYLYKESEYSRSGKGIQTSVKISKGSRYKPTSYISSFINKYREKLIRLQ